MDPKFALAWALLSYVDARGYRTGNLQVTDALRDEARRAAETALALQPDLGEALVAKGYYHYACLKDYDTAVRYYEQARQFLPNNSRIPELLAFAARRQGQWDRSGSYFGEAERLDPRNLSLLTQHARFYVVLRRFPEALRTFDRILEIAPGDIDALVEKAAIAQAEGDLPRASAILAPLHPPAGDPTAWETLAYQAILERRPAEIIPRLKELLASPDVSLGYYVGELRFWLGWAQEVAGDAVAAKETGQVARRELEAFSKEQPNNYGILYDVALVAMALGDKPAALSAVDRAMAANPIATDPLDGPQALEVLVRIEARIGEPERAIATLEKILSIPCDGVMATGIALTPARLRLDPMFDPLRNDPRFQKLAESSPK